jgi:hypothetical protein
MKLVNFSGFKAGTSGTRIRTAGRYTGMLISDHDGGDKNNSQTEIENCMLLDFK